VNVAREIAQKLQMNYVFGCKFQELTQGWGIPILEIIHQDTITILEADDMDRQITFPAAVISAIIGHLGNLM
jgi:hypothetical protein